MSDTDQYIGKVTALGDSYALIESYNEDEGTFTVKLMSVNEAINLLPEQIELTPPSDFDERYPNAPTILASNELTEFPDGSLIDCCKLKSSSGKHGTTTIRGPCRVYGVSRPPFIWKIGLSTLSNSIVVETVGPDDIVEFENINFISQDNALGRQLLCNRGQIIFRQCDFRNNARGLEVGNGDSTATVILENCRFTNHAECGLLLNSGKVKMINCYSVETKIPASVRSGTTLEAYSCHVKDGGIVVASHGELHLIHSVFGNLSDPAVVFKPGARGFVKQCNLFGCQQDLMVIEGGKQRTDVIVDDCYLEGAGLGIKIGFGKVDVQLHGCTIKHFTTGVYVAEDTIGSLVASRCEFLPSTTRYANVSGGKCYVRIDGLLHLRLPGTQRVELERHRALIASTPSLRTGTTSTSKRVLKDAGFIDVACSMCRTIAQDQDMFKKCAGCKVARYCSRDCQKAHWTKHKLDCAVQKVRALIL